MKSKDWIIRAISSKTGFSMKDTRDFLNAFVDVVRERIIKNEPFLIKGLFKMYITSVKSHSGWNIREKRVVRYPESYRIVFKASRELLDLIDQKKQTEFYKDDDVIYDDSEIYDENEEEEFE